MSEEGQSLPPLVPTEDTEEVAVSALDSVERIRHDAGRDISERTEIARLVEAPLIPAVEALYDRNVPTHDSSANPEGGVYLSLLLDKMSPANQQVAERLLASEHDTLPESRRYEVYSDQNLRGIALSRRLILHGDPAADSPEAVEEYFKSFAEQFEEQDLGWAGLTAEEVEKSRKEGFDPIEDGYVVANDGRAYPSAELAQKQNAWLAKQPTEN